MSKAKQSRPTREEILKGIDYQPLVMGKGVPECVRAAEDRRLQDEIVNWTLDFTITWKTVRWLPHPASW